MRIVLGVTGGIAAYKAAHVLRGLRERGHSVRVVPTEAALRFVGAPTWEALSGEPVSTTVFERIDAVEHVHIGQDADLLLIAPATADLLAKARAGIASDLLTATLLTATCPIVAAPAMHTEMWLNAATRDNVATLRSRGWHIIEPAVGRLTGADSGPGRLPEPEDIIAAALNAVGEPASAGDAASGDDAEPGLLSGRRVVVTAGGTREPLDPVRFLGNRSSGKQGAALARAASAAGATVELIAANIDAAVLAYLPDAVFVTAVETTAELAEAVAASQPSADVVIMAAAVADYRPAASAEHKIKKDGSGTGMTIELVENPDVLRGLVAARADGTAPSSQIIVGFAAETGSPDASAHELAEAKLLRKGCDLLVFNDVSAGRAFGTSDNAVTVYAPSADGSAAVVVDRADGSKDSVSLRVISAVADRLEK